MSGCQSGDEPATDGGTTTTEPSPRESTTATPQDPSRFLSHHPESLTITDDERYHSAHPGVVFAESVELDPSAGDALEIENAETDAALSLEPEETIALDGQSHVRCMLYGADGTPADSTKLIQRADDIRRHPVRVSGSVSEVFGSMAPAIRIRHLSGGEVEHETGVGRVVVGYSGLLQQSGTSGEIRLWVPRQGLPEGITAEGRLERDGGDPFTFSLTDAAGSDRLETTIDSTRLQTGTYDWLLNFSHGDRTLLSFGSAWGGREFEAIPRIEISN